jgi:DNA-binding cell septation regulator SpoVG
MKIEVVDIRYPKESKNVLAFVDILLDDQIKVRDFHVMRKIDGDGKPYVQNPHRGYRANGKLVLAPLINFTGELQSKIEVAVLEAYFRERERLSGTTCKE